MLKLLLRVGCFLRKAVAKVTLQITMMCTEISFVELCVTLSKPIQPNRSSLINTQVPFQTLIVHLHRPQARTHAGETAIMIEILHGDLFGEI